MNPHKPLEGAPPKTNDRPLIPTHSTMPPSAPPRTTLTRQLTGKPSPSQPSANQLRSNRSEYTPRPAKPRSPRQLAREMAVQSLYHSLLNPMPMEFILAQVIRDQSLLMQDQSTLAPSLVAPTHSAASHLLPRVSQQVSHITHRPLVFAGALMQSNPCHDDRETPPIREMIIASPNRPKPPIAPIRPDRGFFRMLALSAHQQSDAIRLALTPLLDRPWVEITPMVLAILILGAYELMFQPITPMQVILNEAIELAKRFGSDDAYRFVNGVLEKLAMVHRADEMANPYRKTGNA